MTVDLLYVAHNRLRYTQETFPALLEHTNWDLVEKLHVLDDRSTDGTSGYLMAECSEFVDRTGQPTSFASNRYGGPVAAMLHAVKHCETDVLVKVDSDLLVCPGWLDALLTVLWANPRLDVLGFEAGFGHGVAPADAERSFYEARHVGGIGAFRTRIFKRRRPQPHGTWFGLTDFQRHYADCGWLTPDLPCPLLDHLPFEPWRSLAASYVEQGWSRSWPVYGPEFAPYWEWHFAEVPA